MSEIDRQKRMTNLLLAGNLATNHRSTKILGEMRNIQSQQLQTDQKRNVELQKQSRLQEESLRQQRQENLIRKQKLDFEKKSNVINYLFEYIDISDSYEAGNVPYFFANKEDLLIYGEAKSVYNPFDENAHYYNGDYVYRVEKLKRDKCRMIEELASKLEIEVYNPYNSNVKLVENLHTDNCRFLGFGLDDIYDEDISDYEFVSPEQYNRTLYANCGESMEEITMVVLLKK